MPQESSASARPNSSAFVAAIFAAVGLSKEHAGEWAKMLVWANLRGTDSHGIIRIPRYIDLIKAKSINAAPNIRVERKPGSAAVVLEADRAPSAVALTRAVAEAVTVARDVRRRLVCGAPPHSHRRDRLLRLAGRGGGLRRHRHERVRPDDDLSGVAGRRRCRPIRSHSPFPARAASPICWTSRPASSPTARSWARPIAARQSPPAGASTRTAAIPPIRKRSRTCCRWRASRARACRS